MPATPAPGASEAIPLRQIDLPLDRDGERTVGPRRILRTIAPSTIAPSTITPRHHHPQRISPANH
ncbi:MAG: hypothetical protein ACKO3P_19875, partial [Planctomycetaceae bacterium]